MQTRSVHGVVTFVRPFLLRKIDRELPAGSYVVETDEEILPGSAALSYRRMEVRLFVARVAGVSEAEMWVLSPRELDEALALDREARLKTAEDADRETIALPLNRARAEALSRQPLNGASHKASIPLYGVLLGVIGLLLATTILASS